MQAHYYNPALGLVNTYLLSVTKIQVFVQFMWLDNETVLLKQEGTTISDLLIFYSFSLFIQLPTEDMLLLDVT